VREAGVGEVTAEDLGRAPVHEVVWPDDDRLEAWAEEAARAVLDEEGIGLPGFARVLARRALPRLRVVQQVDWRDGSVPVVGAEVDASIPLPEGREGAGRRLHFRADRVDRGQAGLVLTDYKTGRVLSDAKRPETRREHLAKEVARGTSLQAAAYARVAPEATGRYLYANEDDPPERVFDVGPEHADVHAAFERAARGLLAGLDAGAFLPRLDFTPDQHGGPCGSCRVREACLQGDSGARRRLLEWAGAAPGRGAFERAARTLWEMGPARPGGDGGG
jgi:hypothetical protein